MPKILINEIDRTTPGTPDGYANYSVLIAGFQKEFSEKEIDDARELLADYNTYVEEYKAYIEGDGDQPDGELPKLNDVAKALRNRDEKADLNGVYEFSSAQDFLDTIGPVAPHYEKDGLSISHYGNQMAYELLKQGYTVIYLPIAPETCAATLADASTWEIFKDKANYDFRFVYHGLLESTDASTTKALQDKIDSLGNTLNLLHSKGVILLGEKELTIAVGNENTFEEIQYVADQQLEAVYMPKEEAYQDLFNELIDPDGLEDTNLIDQSTGEYYASRVDAISAVLTQLRGALLAKSRNIQASVINAANTNIANLAKYAADSKDEVPGRGDCVALIELDENTYANAPLIKAKPEVAIIEAINDMASNISGIGKYCAMTVPSVVYAMSNAAVTVNGELIDKPFAENKKFPGAFHYLTCFMSALQSGFAEWYAAAGYTRGVSGYTIDYTTVTLGEVAINALEPRNRSDKSSPMFACNVIANFRGSYYLWGNRTCHKLGNAFGNDGDLVASHFLNIRQLCITIKKQLYIACRRFTFDPNSDTLWFNFVNAIKPTLDAMKADQGIRDYKILKVPTDKKATLKAKIRIVPIEAVEDFDLEVSLEDSFGETTAVVAE